MVMISRGNKVASKRSLFFGSSVDGGLWAGRKRPGDASVAKIKEAEQLLRSLLGTDRLTGKTFLDAGCGSGLISLAARRFGAAVYSFDVDPAAIAEAEQLRRRVTSSGDDWIIQTGSVLDFNFLSLLGYFDIVFAREMVQATGEMWTALSNLSPLVAVGGSLHVTVPNDFGTGVPRATAKGRHDTHRRRAQSAGRTVSGVTETGRERARVETVVGLYSKDGFRLTELKSPGGHDSNFFTFARLAARGTVVENSPGEELPIKCDVVGLYQHDDLTVTGFIPKLAPITGAARRYLVRDNVIQGEPALLDGSRVLLGHAPDISPISAPQYSVITAEEQELAEIEPARGQMWSVYLPMLRDGADTAQDAMRSQLILLEDQMLLSSAHSVHDDIADVGAGGYSHWEDNLYFSTSDNSDPRHNGRRYSVLVRSEPVVTREPTEEPADTGHSDAHFASSGLGDFLEVFAPSEPPAPSVEVSSDSPQEHTGKPSTIEKTSLIGAYRVKWNEHGLIYEIGSENHRPADIYLQALAILPRAPRRFSFIAPSDEIRDLSVLLATYARTNTVAVLATLLDENNVSIGESYFGWDAIHDNQYLSLFGSDIRLVKGRQYTIELTSPSATSGDGYAVYGYSVEQGTYSPIPTIVDADHEFLFSRRNGRPTLVSGGPSITVLIFESPGSPEMASVAIQRIRALFPGQPFRYQSAGAVRRGLQDIVNQDIVILAGSPESVIDLPGMSMRKYPYQGFDELAFALHRAGVCTIFLDVTNSDLGIERSDIRFAETWNRRFEAVRQLGNRCHFAAATFADAFRLWDTAAAEFVVTDKIGDGAAFTKELVDTVRSRARPSVAIISVLYKKAEIVPTFIEMVNRQSYDGPITMLFVDDCSPDDSVKVVSDLASIQQLVGSPNVTIKLIENEDNLGNCISRNRGLAEIEADLYIIIDCDCLINRDFVAAHVFEHWWPKTDVVIGPLNIESNDRWTRYEADGGEAYGLVEQDEVIEFKYSGRAGYQPTGFRRKLSDTKWPTPVARDPRRLLIDLEQHPERITLESKLHDTVLRTSLLNCVTRNFSIKRNFLDSDLFDPDFTYSAKPGSGNGWEDLEMGYRLYEKGAVVRYTESAFSVHASHPSSVPEEKKAVGSIRNFNRLFAKHSDLALVSRRWAVDAIPNMLGWLRGFGHEDNPDKIDLEQIFSRPGSLAPAVLRAPRRLRILTYRWHAPHQYEIYKLPHDFTLVTGAGSEMSNQWAYDQRPLRDNVRLVPREEVRIEDYDAAILHFDENVLAPHATNYSSSSDWGSSFRWFLANVQLPRVAICHGTPQFVGQYGANPDPIEEFEIYEGERQILVDALREIDVVLNSWQAKHEWGFHKSRVIWHGFDPQEFPPATYRRDVLTSSLDWSRPHYRGTHELIRVGQLLNEGIRIETTRHDGASVLPRHGNAFATANFRSYVDYIRQFTAFLNTTLRSPMPRSRGEAMMCGVIPVCLRNHDIDLFVRHGVDGFYADEPEELAEYLNFLMSDKRAAEKIGRNARLTALDVFNHDRYLAEWNKLLQQIV